MTASTHSDAFHVDGFDSPNSVLRMAGSFPRMPLRHRFRGLSAAGASATHCAAAKDTQFSSNSFTERSNIGSGTAAEIFMLSRHLRGWRGPCIHHRQPLDIRGGNRERIKLSLLAAALIAIGAPAAHAGTNCQWIPSGARRRPIPARAARTRFRSPAHSACSPWARPPRSACSAARRNKQTTDAQAPASKSAEAAHPTFRKRPRRPRPPWSFWLAARRGIVSSSAGSACCRNLEIPRVPGRPRRTRARVWSSSPAPLARWLRHHRSGRGPRTFAWPPIQTPSPTCGPSAVVLEPILVCCPTVHPSPRRQWATSTPPKC